MLWSVIVLLTLAITTIVGCSGVLISYEEARGQLMGIRYYECRFTRTTQQNQDINAQIPVVKFMVDVYFHTAFRNDLGPARPVKLLKDTTESIILVDHIPGIEISLLVMEKDGQAAFMRHLLRKDTNNANDSASTRFSGKCFEIWDVAYLHAHGSAAPG